VHWRQDFGALEAKQGPTRAYAEPSLAVAVPRLPTDGQPTRQSGRPGRTLLEDGIPEITKRPGALAAMPYIGLDTPRRSEKVDVEI